MPRPMRRRGSSASAARAARSRTKGSPTSPASDDASRREGALVQVLGSLDLMSAIARAVAPGDLLAFSLSCRAMRAGQLAARRALRTPESSVLSSEARIAWALSLGLAASRVVPWCAARGDTQLLIHAREVGLPWRGGWACSLAAEHARFDMLKVMRSLGVEWDSRVCRGLATSEPRGAFAGETGATSDMELKRLCMLKWARGEGAPWCPQTFERASESGFKLIHSWAIRMGCPTEECEGCGGENTYNCFVCAEWGCTMCDGGHACGDEDGERGCGEWYCMEHPPWKPCRVCDLGMCPACVAKEECPPVACVATGCRASYCNDCAPESTEQCENCEETWCLSGCASGMRGFYCHGCGFVLCRDCIDEADRTQKAMTGVAFLLLLHGH